MPVPLEFGHQVLIIEDSANFIVHAEVMSIGMTDEKILADVMKRLQEQYNDKIRPTGFDKGFWSPADLKELSQRVAITGQYCTAENSSTGKDGATARASIPRPAYGQDHSSIIRWFRSHRP